jgi:hypothetical protein
MRFKSVIKLTMLNLMHEFIIFETNDHNDEKPGTRDTDKGRFLKK